MKNISAIRENAIVIRQKIWYNIMQNNVRGVYALYKFRMKIFSAAVAALMLCCCTEIDEEPPVITAETVVTENPYPVTVGSFVFNEKPMLVGSLSPAITEIICELGYSYALIGRSSYCDYPETVLDKLDLGSAANPDVDTIIDSAPQLLISHSPIAKKDITAIENVGTRVWIIPAPNSVEELYNYYRDIASVFGGKLISEDYADKAMRPLLDALNSVDGSVESFVYIMSPELAVATDSTFAGSFFSSFGKNAAGDSEEIVFTDEELSELNPEWVIIPYTLSGDNMPNALSSLDAVQSGRVIVLDEEMLERIERPTSRLEAVVYSIKDQIKSTDDGNPEDPEE